MKISIDAILATVKPWDFSIELGGVDYAVRRLSSADFKRLSESATHTEADNREFLAAMFEGQAPDVAAWDQEKASAVFGAVITYYQQVVIRKISTRRPRQ